MSIVEQKAFLASIHPFDTLSNDELERVLGAMDIAYYPKETILCDATKGADRLYMIIKGSVKASDDEGNVEYFGALDTLCASELLQKSDARIYRVVEELLCYELPKELFLKLLEANDAYKTFYLEDIATRLQALREQSRQTEFTEFLTARIRDIFIHAPYTVKGSTPINKAVAGMEAAKATAILVRHENQTGIVTDTDLRRRVILGGAMLDEPIARVATYGLVTIERDGFLFNALLMMTRHGIKRLAVTQNGEICGIIEQIDLLSYFSNHSYLLSVQIEKAGSVEELKTTMDGFINIVRALHNKGVKARYIARIVSELNAKVFAKVFELAIPEAWHPHVALMVMGSEGREEQIIRTDQDNGLLIADGFQPEGLEEKMERFSEALKTLGFPECPGRVMINNPEWRKPLDAFKQDIDTWIDVPEGDAMMKLAILLDARCVAGNTDLLADLRHYLFERMSNHPTALALFAQAVENFEIPLGWMGTFGKEHIDLKKGGSFILMHGIRALALEQKIEATPTIERIKRLNDIGLIDRKFATELIESFDVILTFILQRKLTRLAQGKTPDNTVDLREFSKPERDMLKDALKVVRELKTFIAYHFKLNMVG